MLTHRKVSVFFGFAGIEALLEYGTESREQIIHQQEHICFVLLDFFHPVGALIILHLCVCVVAKITAIAQWIFFFSFNGRFFAKIGVEIPPGFKKKKSALTPHSPPLCWLQFFCSCFTRKKKKKTMNTPKIYWCSFFVFVCFFFYRFSHDGHHDLSDLLF